VVRSFARRIGRISCGYVSITLRASSLQLPLQRTTTERESSSRPSNARSLQQARRSKFSWLAGGGIPCFIQPPTTPLLDQDLWPKQADAGLDNWNSLPAEDQTIRSTMTGGSSGDSAECAFPSVLVWCCDSMRARVPRQLRFLGATRDPDSQQSSLEPSQKTVTALGAPGALAVLPALT